MSEVKDDVCGGEGFPDLSDLRVPQVEVPAGRARGAAGPSGRRSGEFLRGPIPLSWWGRACELPGKALAVASAVWWLAGVRGGKDNLRLTSPVLERFGVTDRSTKYRALRALKKAGLIRVDGERGKNPEVTILPDDRGR
jgi:hypothetical protein